MKIALVGDGKTGQKFVELASNAGHSIEIFNSKKIPTFEALSQSQIIVSFLPGGPFSNYIELFRSTNLPVVTGSTGFIWPKDIDQLLKDDNLTWIYANNFSLGMSLVQEMINTLSHAPSLFDKIAYEINETHHTQKLDAPSGTALSWKEWLKNDCVKINSHREGDVIGIHELTLETEVEKITLTHEALDRSIFAKGALWACQYLIENKSVPKGLIHFSTITSTLLKG